MSKRANIIIDETTIPISSSTKVTPAIAFNFLIINQFENIMTFLCFHYSFELAFFRLA